MMTARILNVSVDEYHALPHFSSSVAKTLIAQSPLHAKSAVGKPPTKGMDRGSIIHRLTLGKGKDYEPLEYADWRTKDAKADRDKARAAGKVPVLQCDLEEYTVAAEKVVAHLADRGIVLDGESELAIEWTEETPHGPVLCKGMLDHCWRSIGLILDLKIVENAALDKVMRSAEDFGYAVQQHAYRRALEELKPEVEGRAKFLFAFCEPEKPFAINLCEPDGMMRDIGARRWHRAVNTWGRCLAENKFPAYGEGVNRLSVPQWAMKREEEIEAESAIAAA